MTNQKAPNTKNKVAGAKTVDKKQDSNEEQSNKNVIIGVCIAVICAIIVAIIVAIVINTHKSLDDSYFISDGNKYVLTIDYSDIADDVDADDAEYAPNKIHEVYTYSGDTVTGLKDYYEYNDANAAKEAADYLREEEPDTNISVDGKYVIIAADEADYSSYTASEIKEAIELYQSSNSASDSTDVEDE